LMVEGMSAGRAGNDLGDATNRLTLELAELKAEDVVLDVGCGRGAAVREAGARVSSGRVVGIDPSAGVLRLAAAQRVSAEQRARIAYLMGEASRLPLADDSITVAWAIDSLHHWGDWAGGLSEIRRVLVPGGRFLIAEEEYTGGKFGHGTSGLLDAETVLRAVELDGFDQVAMSRYREGDQTVVVISGLRPGGGP
jgi:ubiquinone/menaquinone biosynthesis C-methylase UbiE